MSMVNFDENQIIANGARIYDQRAKIEAIADSIVDNGFDLLLFTSSGGSQAMLDPMTDRIYFFQTQLARQNNTFHTGFSSKLNTLGISNQLVTES